MESMTTLYLIAAYFWLAGGTTVFLCRLNGVICSSFARSTLSGLVWPLIWTILGFLYVSSQKAKNKTR